MQASSDQACAFWSLCTLGNIHDESEQTNSSLLLLRCNNQMPPGTRGVQPFHLHHTQILHGLLRHENNSHQMPTRTKIWRSSKRCFCQSKHLGILSITIHLGRMFLARSMTQSRASTTAPFKISSPKKSISAASFSNPREWRAEAKDFDTHKSLPSFYVKHKVGAPGTSKWGCRCRWECLKSPTGTSTKPLFDPLSSLAKASPKFFLTKFSSRTVSFPLFILPTHFSLILIVLRGSGSSSSSLSKIVPLKVLPVFFLYARRIGRMVSHRFVEHLNINIFLH